MRQAPHFLGRFSQWAQRDGADAKSVPAGIATDVPAPTRRRKTKPAGGGGARGSVSIGRLEKQIEEAEQQIGRIDTQLMDPDVYTDGKRCRGLQQQREALRKTLGPLEEEWARRAGAE